MPSDYRLSPLLAARVVGALLVALGLIVVLLTVAVSLLDLSAAVLVIAVGVAVAALVVALVLLRRASVVRLDEVGYRVRFVRGAGVEAARWTDVEDVVATTAGGERCVVLRLRDGRTTTVPVRLLAGDTDAFVKDLQAHLNTGHGYRRLN